MTNKEAIKNLIEMRSTEFSLEYSNALSLAIAALERYRWASVEDEPPPFHLNDSGCLTTNILCFRCEDSKTVHMGYCIKEAFSVQDWGGTAGTIIALYWYDQAGNDWDDVTEWFPLPSFPGKERA